MINTVNTERSKTLKQRTSNYYIHSSSCRNLVMGEKWRHFDIRFWRKRLKKLDGSAQRRTKACKLFSSRFKMFFCEIFSLKLTTVCFHKIESKIWRLTSFIFTFIRVWLAHIVDILGVIEESQETTEIQSATKQTEGFGCYTQEIRKNKHRNNAVAASASGHRHTGTLNRGKMKIFKKHQIFELIRIKKWDEDAHRWTKLYILFLNKASKVLT